MNEGSLVLLATLSGMCFSLIGVSFRFGMARGIEPLHITVITALAGLVFFGVRGWGSASGGIPNQIIILAMVTGVSQYGITRLMKVALKLGPLSPLWCATMLSFIPVIAYASVVLGEAFTGLHAAATAVAMASVMLAAKAQGASSAGGAMPTPVKPFKYGAVLIAILVLNGIPGISLKEMSMHADAHGVTYLERFTDTYFALFFAALEACVLADVALTRSRPASVRRAALLGVVTSTGSVLGLSMLSRCAVLPAAVAFTVNSVASILFTALLASVLFREARTRAWYATLACGILAIALANGPSLTHFLHKGP